MKLSNLIKITLPVVIAVAGVFNIGSAQADQCPLVPDGRASMEGSQAADLLSDGKFEQVEAILEKWHRKNLSSEGGDLLTLRNINELLQLSMRQENLVRMWADERPQSFFSQLTAGIYYIDDAGHVLGGRPMSQVSPGQLKKVRQLNETAAGYLHKAMQLDPRSALPQGMMIDVACVQGQVDGKTAEQWLQAANEVDPKNLAARIQAVNYLSPRWCGSFELLDQMVQDAAKSLSAESAHYLEYNVVLAKASHEEVIAKNKLKANELFKRAKNMCENSDAAREGVIRTYR